MELAALIELDPFCRFQGFYKFGSSPARSRREDGSSHLAYFLQELEADTILFNSSVREVPAVAKYLPPMWFWVAPLLGSIGLKTEAGGVSWEVGWDYKLRPQVAAQLENSPI